jgi:hypothetical protein
MSGTKSRSRRCAVYREAGVKRWALLVGNDVLATTVGRVLVVGRRMRRMEPLTKAVRIRQSGFSSPDASCFPPIPSRPQRRQRRVQRWSKAVAEWPGYQAQEKNCDRQESFDLPLAEFAAVSGGKATRGMDGRSVGGGREQGR